jgi:hypothetical protein
VDPAAEKDACVDNADPNAHRQADKTAGACCAALAYLTVTDAYIDTTMFAASFGRCLSRDVLRFVFSSTGLTIACNWFALLFGSLVGVMDAAYRPRPGRV